MSKPQGAQLSVEWGYEQHRFAVCADDWARIRTGHRVTLAGEGYHHKGMFFRDDWHLNDRGPGTLTVTYGDEGAVGFQG